MDVLSSARTIRRSDTTTIHSCRFLVLHKLNERPNGHEEELPSLGCQKTVRRNLRFCVLLTVKTGENDPGQVAQLVEQRTENPCVGGSIPSLSTRSRWFSLPFTAPVLVTRSGLRYVARMM